MKSNNNYNLKKNLKSAKNLMPASNPLYGQPKKFFLVYGHVAYQIEGIKAYNTMLAIINLVYIHPWPLGRVKQFLSESCHFAYQR